MEWLLCENSLQKRELIAPNSRTAAKLCSAAGIQEPMTLGRSGHIWPSVQAQCRVLGSSFWLICWLRQSSLWRMGIHAGKYSTSTKNSSADPSQAACGLSLTTFHQHFPFHRVDRLAVSGPHTCSSRTLGLYVWCSHFLACYLSPSPLMSSHQFPQDPA